MKISKYLAVVAMVALLSGCGYFERVVGTVTGVSKMCVDGVVYLQFTSGASVQVDPTGKPVACK